MLSTPLHQFNLTRFLVAITFVCAACGFFADLRNGALRSLVDAPAVLAMLAAALASLVGTARHVCLATAATFLLLPTIVAGGYLMIAVCWR